MFDAYGPRIFEALRQAAEAELGADHPVAVAAKAAADAPAADASSADATRQVQTTLQALGADQTERLMRTVHRALQEDALSSAKAPSRLH